MNVPGPGSIVYAAWIGRSWILVEQWNDGWVTQDGGRQVDAELVRKLIVTPRLDDLPADAAVSCTGKALSKLPEPPL